MKAITVVALIVVAGAGVWAQRGVPIGVPRAPIGDGPWILDTAEQHKIKVSIVAGGLVNPWSMAWLPNGDILITERPGRLRLLHKDGVLDATPISGVPIHRARQSSLSSRPISKYVARLHGLPMPSESNARTFHHTRCRDVSVLPA